MYLAISMPTWLVDFWTIYGEMIEPVLITIVLALLTSLALKIKSDAKTNAAKAELQIQALKDVANREDNKPELEKLSAEIAALKYAVELQSEMFDLAFQNSNLTPEIKDNLSSLINKIKYGTEEDLVKELENENSKLLEEISALKLQLEDKLIVVADEKPLKRTRR